MLREEPERLSRAAPPRARAGASCSAKDAFAATWGAAHVLSRGRQDGAWAARRKLPEVFGPNVDGVKVGEWNGRADGEAGKAEISRKYTPTSSRQAKGA